MSVGIMSVSRQHDAVNVLLHPGNMLPGKMLPCCKRGLRSLDLHTDYIFQLLVSLVSFNIVCNEDSL